MIKILITGRNSYIGTSFEAYIKKEYPNDYEINTLDVKNESWSSFNFRNYDVIFHVAGIAHSDNGKISKDKEKLYRLVNTELTLKIAQKAKEDGVKQFIFMSSAIIYGESGKIGKNKMISRSTPPNPSNCYGDSKLQAEIGLSKLNGQSFNVVILRCPMIYGKNSKGNFSSLIKMSNLPFFPNIKNERSMLFIGNLVEFVRLMIKNKEKGIFWPQNLEWSNTSLIVKKIAETKGKKVHLLSGTTVVMKFLSLFLKKVNKAFGNLTFSHEISFYKEKYQIYTLDESIKLSI